MGLDFRPETKSLSRSFVQATYRSIPAQNGLTTFKGETREPQHRHSESTAAPNQVNAALISSPIRSSESLLQSSDPSLIEDPYLIENQSPDVSD